MAFVGVEIRTASTQKETKDGNLRASCWEDAWTMTERGDMMREVIKRMHEMFASEPWRDGLFYVVPSAGFFGKAFIVENYGPNRAGSLSKFLAYKSGWYTKPEEWFFEVIR